MEELKTSNEWYHEIYPDGDLIIYDPDGWDRSNYHYSFYEEKITRKEFEWRISGSTCIFSKKKS